MKKILIMTLGVFIFICSCNKKNTSKNPNRGEEIRSQKATLFLKDTSTLIFINRSSDVIILKVSTKDGKKSVLPSSVLNYAKVDDLTVVLHTKAIFNYSDPYRFDTVPPNSRRQYYFDYSANTQFLRDYKDVVISWQMIESHEPRGRSYSIPVEKMCEDEVYRQSFNNLVAERDTVHLTNQLSCDK